MTAFNPLGVAISGGLNASELVDCVRRAEALNYTSAWVAEGHGGDQFALLGACAALTEKIALGTSISSVFVRSAPTIAMSTASVDELSKGRCILGLGSSHKVQVEPEHGVEYSLPLTRTRDYVAIVRELLATGQCSYAGKAVSIENFDLWFKPFRPNVPIYISALFPKMLALAGEVADGVILTRSTLETAADVRQQLDAASEAAGRPAGSVKITSLLPTAVAKNRAEALDLMRPGIAFYAGFFPRYNRLLASFGFATETQQIAEAFARGDHAGATRAVSDALVDATSVSGTPEQCREKIAAYRDSGIDEPIISPFARGDGAAGIFSAAVEACAGA
jgi:probable F420-dependent oxidoreductase